MKRRAPSELTQSKAQNERYDCAARAVWPNDSVVSVANTTEFNFRYWLGSGSIENQALSESANSSFTFESAIYWGAGRKSKFVISPEQINERQIKLAEELLGIHTVCIVPAGGGLLVSARARIDKSLYRTLARPLGDNPGGILAWGPTSWFAALVERLRREMGTEVTSEYSPTHADKLADHLNNKIEQKPMLVRTLGEHCPLKIPEYVIVHDSSSVELIDRYVRVFNRKAVVKSPCGWGGRASLRLNYQSAKAHDKLNRGTLAKHFATHSAFYRSGVVIEEMVTGRAKRELCVDGYIDEKGNVSLWPSHTLVSQRQAIGMVVGRHVLDDKLAMAMRGCGARVAGMLVRLGYRGWFDVDFLQAERKLYVLEINARRTGGTALIEIGKHAFGGSWMNDCVVQSIDRMSVNTRIRTRQIVDYFFDLSWKYRENGVKVLPLHLRGLDQANVYGRHFGYVVCADNKTVCSRIHQAISDFVTR
jgi:hypothetical protein